MEDVALQMKRLALVISLLFVAALSAFADVERGISIIETVIRVAPDRDSAKLANMDRGHEVVVLDKSKGWIQVEAEVNGIPQVFRDDDTPEPRTVTGWLPDKGIIRPNTPNGDRIVFGEAADSEAEASRRHGRRGAAQDAMRLYALLAEYFPNSPLAGEALYRAADIRWQIEKADAMSRPSAKERDPYLRSQMNEDLMKKVIKKYPGTKWADLASFSLIDNKLCGDWQGTAKCPEKESDIYEKYAAERPQSPAAPEALYDAAWRQSALIEIYKTDNKTGKSEDAKKRAIALAQKVISQYPNNVDWSTKAQRLLFLLEQGVPTYGNQ
jgi:outer membrane protein assembly factor BamD (BamD/ComL family)